MAIIKGSGKMKEKAILIKGSEKGEEGEPAGEDAFSWWRYHCQWKTVDMVAAMKDGDFGVGREEEAMRQWK
ncbi:hypothetical protein SESBI_46159 [Sesbania bispinosa]|nr:hypothetical protein SESBI_46159 [Sesbania bispinosa]